MAEFIIRIPRVSVAVAEAGDPARALDLIDALDLGDYRYLPSTRAELLRRLGRTDEARSEFERALALATTEAERRLLERRLVELRPGAAKEKSPARPRLGPWRLTWHNRPPNPLGSGSRPNNRATRRHRSQRTMK